MPSIRAWVSFVVASSAVLMAAGPGCGGGDAGTSVFDPDASMGLNDGGHKGQPDSTTLFNSDGSNAVADGGKPACTPRTCAQLVPPVGCGSAGDGCGNVIQCGSCMAPQTCGGGDPDAGKPGAPSQCGGTMGCTPKTCTDYPAGTCGPQPDGCGGLTPSCTTCAAPATCGGDSTKPGQCGTGAVVCTPKTCADYPGICGPQSDGCNGLTANCNACAAPATCGGAGTPDKCGAPPVPDAGVLCVPKTCTDLPAVCGQQADGCGGVTAACNPCSAPSTCGGGGTPGKCGTTCVPKTCASFPGVCGQQSDGCGGVTATCNACSAPSTCGGGGTPGKCGSPTMNCTPLTCAQACAAAGIASGQCCGQFADGCGGVTTGCGSCVPPAICGGGGVASTCGDSNLDGGVPCTGLCGQIPSCGGGGTTTLTGRVYAPTDPTLGYGAPDPIQHAHVFIPNDPSSLAAFGTTVACACDTASGPAIATTYSAVDGSFTLSNVPAGNNIPIVIQLGRWRRVFYTNIAACVTAPPPGTTGTNGLTDDAACQAGGTCNTRLPRHQAEFNAFDNIPLIADVTGSADSMECILPKMGIDATSYSDPGGGGRVQFYQANGATFSGATPNESQLWSSTATLAQYDMVIMDCEGAQKDETPGTLANMQAYANAGGRLFTTHYSYVWTYNIPNWGCGNNCTTAGQTVANWNVNRYDLPDPVTAIIDNPTMLSWLSQPLVGVITPPGNSIQVSQPRDDLDSVVPPNAMGVPATQLFMHAQQAPGTPLEFTFNTDPYGTAAQQCGRVLFSDFHVYGAAGANFPGECVVAPLTPQEKVLEFMLFDLGDCVTSITPPPPPTCTSKTCATYPAGTCGVQSDGCGAVTANCGTCVFPQTCGGGGVPGRCGGGCNPKTCASYPGACGQQSDGCGGLTANCGSCPSTCTPETCASYPAGTCGAQSNGCGALTTVCGSCAPPSTCGGGGVAGMCGAPDAGQICAPACPASVQCGPAGDGCGGTIASCGTCPPGQVCGAGGPGKCGTAPACTPKTCASYPATCGQQSDGCGGLTTDCGACKAPQTCGGGGTPGTCGAPNCTPLTCAQTCAAAGVTTGCCGQFADGCGGLTTDCGTCASPATCGGGNVANKCAAIIK